MAEPIPEIPKQEPLVIGETPLYLKSPAIVGNETVHTFTVLGKDQRATSGGGSAVILTREPSRKKENRGELVEKENLNFDRMDTKNWDEIAGIRFRDEAGNAVDVPKEALSLTRTSPQSPESPLSISIVGLRAFEGRALDLADRSMQKLSKDIGTVIWKQSIGGIYFHEKARQYYLDMLKASETPFAEEAIRMAERRATDIYNKKLSDVNFLKRIGTKAWEWFKDKTGMRTTIQTLALEEIGRMKTAGEIAGMETLERESAAVRARFEKDFETAGNLVRETLGEKKLKLLDETDERNLPIVTGIKEMMKRYATGEIADKAALDAEAKKFFSETLKTSRPDLVPEAELYTSSLFEAAENLRAKVSHEAGIANIDSALAGIQVKLGLAQMGEVTSLDPTSVERGIGKVRDVVEWLNKKHIIVPLVINEATIGTGVALALTTVHFFKTVPARAFGAGALAGGIFAGWREYGQIHKDYLTHLRQRETGATFTETQKRRQWFERFAPQQRSATEMTKTIEAAMESGDYRTAMATIADLQARKAVSETGPKRIGLVQYNSRDAIESERTALDLVASKALGDLGNLSDLGNLLGGNDFPQFMEKLTVLQTRVLREGVQILTTMEDPINATLNLVSQYAPEANLLKRRWPFAAGTEVKAAGMDAIMEEFKKEARLESVKYGIKAGVVGAAVGAAFHGIGELFAHRADIGEGIQNMKEAIGPHTPETLTFTDISSAPQTGPVPLTYDPTKVPVTIANTQYQIPQQLDIVSHAGKSFDAVLHAPQGDIPIGDHLNAIALKEALDKAGFALEGGPKEEILTTITKPIPDLALTDGHALTAQIPDGYSLDHTPSGWDLLGPDGKIVVPGLRFNPDGTLENADVLKEAGFQVDPGKSFDYEIPGTEKVTTLNFGNDMTIQGKDLGEGGMWDYFLGKSPDVPTANGMKNLFRLYTFDHHNENIASAHVLATREAYFGDELDLTRIPNDANIRLPESVFGQDAINEFSKLNTIAIERMNTLVAEGAHDIKGPMHAIRFMDTQSDSDKLYATVLRLGYVGQDDKLPSQENIQLLYEKLGATMHTSGGQAAQNLTLHEVVISKIPEAPVTELGKIVAANTDGTVNLHYFTEVPKTVQEQLYEHVLGEKAPPETAEFPWFPIFIPYRNVLEAVPVEVVTEAGAKERKPQHVAVREYLDALSEEEKQFLAGPGLPPVSPDIRAAVIIPVSPLHGSNVVGRLSSYLNQDALNKTEFLVVDTLGVKEDVDKFVADHPDMKVLYVAGPSYAEASAGKAGKIKRDATNIVISRVATMPEDSPDVAIVMDNGTGGTISNQYLSTIIDTFDQNANLETVGGAYTLPQEMYSGFPILFARFRAVELMDAMIRHGEAGGIPPTYAGNLGVRAGSLAAAGGYKPDIVAGEDRVVVETIGNAQTLPAMTAAFDPKEISYATLQSLDLADATVPLAANETYKDMPWEEMAKRANEAYTNKHLEADLTRIYAAMPHDEYFKRTMDTLGIQYEIKDGAVTILSTDTLAQNMTVPLDVEEFAKAEHEKTAREHLETLAGEQPAQPEEKPTDVVASSLSSPDLGNLGDLGNLEEKPQEMPMGVEDRMNLVLKESKNTQASVQLSPGELMDYIKSSVDIAGSRITDGNIVIDGNTVKLTDMKADIRYNKAHIGEGNFSAMLLTDPQKGLVVDHQTLKMKLPFMIKMVGGAKMLREGLDNFNGLVTDHINTRIDPMWKAERIDIVGEKLEIKFTKKA